LKQVILRVDDIHGATDPEQLWQLYSPCWEQGIPVCLSVIPRSVLRFQAEIADEQEEQDIRRNKALVAFIADLLQREMVEIALHGWRHHRHDLVNGGSQAIGSRLASGLSILNETWPAARVRVLVPPFELMGRDGLEAARGLGLDICSTWATCHGGSRLAHWGSRWRRWRGLRFDRAGDGLWPTDIDLLDFKGPERRDGPQTERLLGLAGRWRSPAVFVQHYWRLFDGQVRDRGDHVGQLMGRWRGWLEAMLKRPDIRFRTFYHD